MPKLDQCHDQVVRALEKAGWRVGENPYILPIPLRRPLQIDLYAQQTTNAKVQTIIIVEVKCFLDPKADLNELYVAIGQYLIYRSLLRQKGILDRLYLAAPSHAYKNIIQQVAMPVIREAGIMIIVVDIDQEVIEQWLE